jgi:hypothetical protein
LIVNDINVKNSRNLNLIRVLSKEKTLSAVIGQKAYCP